MRSVSFLFRSCRRLVALSFLGLLLTACGGGDNNPPSVHNPPDTTPDTFTIAPLTDAAPDLHHVSDAVTITGINFATPITVAGTDCAYAIDDGAFTAEAGTVTRDQAVRVQARAMNAYDAARACTLTIGDVAAHFDVTTGSNGFAFEIQPGTLSLDWDGFTGVSHYELTRHNAATGESVFVAEDIAAGTTEFTTALSNVLLADWINDRFTLSACNDSGCVTLPDHDAVLEQALSAQAITYVKASNTEAFDEFGYSVALDGDTLAVGARREASAATGVDGDQADNSAVISGAVYVFQRSDGIWNQAAYLKASNTEAHDEFGFSLALDGDTLAVGARFEGSGVNGDPADNSAGDSGAVYIFQRTNGVWNQSAYLKASNIGAGDWFGYDVALHGDTLAVGARREASAATGVDGDDDDNSADNSGAVYVFQRTGDTWAQAAYLKASNTDAGDWFGSIIALNGDTLAVGAAREDSGASDDQNDNSAENSGAVYVFHRTGGTWAQAAYLKASNTEAGDWFGYSIALDGHTLAVGAHREDSAATGMEGDQISNSAPNSGAVYIFQRTDDTWAQAAYLKASNTGSNDLFGNSVALNGDTLAIGAALEGSATNGVDGDQADNSAVNSGAVYVFRRSDGIWNQAAYLKASNTEAHDEFGGSLALDDDTLAVGTLFENSASTGVNGEQTDDCDTADATNCASESGAVYIF